MPAPRASHTGITTRHRNSCPASEDAGAGCRCSPTYRAQVYDARTRRKLRKSFHSFAAARAWRSDAEVALRQGKITAALSPHLSDAAAAWLDGALAGAIRNRSGDRYKPSVLRQYETTLRLRLLPEFGAVRLSELQRKDLQGYVDRLLLDGVHNPSTIRNTLVPLRVIFRRAVVRGEVAVNPTIGLEIPAVRGRRERIASPAEAERLLNVLAQDHAIWATAMYSGLRLGEILALKWEDVDLDVGLIHVRRAWDQAAGYIEPKSRAGKRTVPLAQVLRTHLVAQRLVCPWTEGLVFGRGPDFPFLPKTPNDRAQRAWKKAGMKPIGLHECRHTFASFMIAAGVNAKALSTYMGHSSVMVTFDRYGHLMPGNEAEAALLLDTYLRSRTR